MATPTALEKEARKNIDQLHYKAQQTTDESLECTRRMQNLCEESTEAGGKTLGMLQCQGEKLEYMQRDMVQIYEEVGRAERNLTKMERCCGLYTLPCRKDHSVKDDQVTWQNSANGKVVSKQPQKILQKHTGPKTQVYQLERITNDAREDEMNKNMCQVHCLVGDLRNMAIDMSLELDGQNKKLETINIQASVNSMRIEGVNKRTHALL